MSLARVTKESAQTLGKGDTVVSPYSSLPFQPLRITETSTSPTGTVMLRIHRLSAVSQLVGGWVPATRFWHPPAGGTWNNAQHIWYVGGLKWQRPTLADLGIERDADGWLPDD